MSVGLIIFLVIIYLVIGFISAIIYQKLDGGYSEPWELTATFLFWPLVAIIGGGIYLFFGIGVGIDWVAEGGFQDLYRKYKEMRDD